METRGQSLLQELAKERDAASEELDFEKAATLHAKIQKVEAVAALASEAVQPLSQLRAIIIQPSSEAGKVALFQLAAGLLTGPANYDTLGMRLHNEQSGSSSLYTHPYALEAVPLAEPAPSTASSQPEESAAIKQSSAAIAAKPKETPRDLLEQRLTEALQTLTQPDTKTRKDTQTIADHLCLFTRWYYRPEAKRVGEAVFYNPDEPPPAKQILRAISRVFRATLPVAAAIPSETANE
jgi:excinuclease UvrABC nuclease subunit